MLRPFLSPSPHSYFCNFVLMIYHTSPCRARKISSVSQLSNIESVNSMENFLESIGESGDELDDTKSQVGFLPSIPSHTRIIRISA